MRNIDDEHKREVRFSVERAIANGCFTFDEILKYCAGPDPDLVKEIVEDVMPNDVKIDQLKNQNLKINHNRLIARRLSANLPLELPAANPLMSQWWFTLDSISSLSDRVWELSKGNTTAFLGTPTVGFHYSHCFKQDASILDADPQVIASLRLPALTKTYTYDVCDDLPDNLLGKHSVALIDPPWYKSFFELFIGRSRELLQDDGFLLCVLPSRLTRPGLIQERTELIKDLIKSNFEIVSLDSKYVLYRVPEFEIQAFNHNQDFSGRWWRRGDLLILRVHKESQFNFKQPIPKKKVFKAFFRNPKKLRFFLNENNIDQSLQNDIETVEDFDTSISTRKFSEEKVSVWGSNKKAATLKNAEIAEMILSFWAKENSMENTIDLLSNLEKPIPKDVVVLFDNILEIWKNDESIHKRRKTEKLEELRENFLSDLVPKPSGRNYDFHSDGFRLDFQRDRDRIIWSKFLKKLAHKSQLFPVKSDDHIRHRLSHTIEVMQIASTIATAFGLDRDLTEAGALAHDIGHTPFGHAGESAIDVTFNQINENLGGFNHYEHGLDIVRWLENVYQSPGSEGHPGLNLTLQTIECIFKHTYFRDGKKPIAQSNLSRNTKHEDIRNELERSCHLEGQAVRIADKISYLISDLEDGIRLEIITIDDLVKCRFFERPPIDIFPSLGEALYERFISQRRAILKVIMEDILTATEKRLVKINTLEDIHNNKDYIVTYSESLKRDITEIWENLQEGILHKDPKVITKNNQAARIVTNLLLLYAISPLLVEKRFREAHNRLEGEKYLNWYKEKRKNEKIGIPMKLLSSFYYEQVIGTEPIVKDNKLWIPIEDLILAKDYIASFTDRQAILEYRKHIGTFGE